MRWLVLLIGLDLAVAAGPLAGQEPLFPLTEGTTWVYAGTIWWTPRGTREVLPERVEWEMVVDETFHRGDVRAALVHGHPEALARIDRERQGGDYLLIEFDGERLYLLEGARAREALERLRDPDDPLEDLVEKEDLVLELPLEAGSERCVPAAERPGYCWGVSDTSPADLRAVRGVESAGEEATRYTVTIRRPAGEHHVWGYVLGMGLTSYAFGHHGMVAAVEVELIEVRPPPAAPEARAP